MLTLILLTIALLASCQAGITPVVTPSTPSPHGPLLSKRTSYGYGSYPPSPQPCSHSLSTLLSYIQYFIYYEQQGIPADLASSLLAAASDYSQCTSYSRQSGGVSNGGGYGSGSLGGPGGVYNRDGYNSVNPYTGGPSGPYGPLLSSVYPSTTIPNRGGIPPSAPMTLKDDAQVKPSNK